MANANMSDIGIYIRLFALVTEDRCMICIKDYVQGHYVVFLRPCGHHMHVQCLRHMLVQAGARLSCPVCRGHFSIIVEWGSIPQADPVTTPPPPPPPLPPHILRFPFSPHGPLVPHLVPILPHFPDPRYRLPPPGFARILLPPHIRPSLPLLQEPLPPPTRAIPPPSPPALLPLIPLPGPRALGHRGGLSPAVPPLPLLAPPLLSLIPLMRPRAPGHRGGPPPVVPPPLLLLLPLRPAFMTCPACLMPFTYVRPARLALHPCGHVYHRDCVFLVIQHGRCMVLGCPIGIILPGSFYYIV